MKHINISRSLGRPKRSEQEQSTDELILTVAGRLFMQKGYQKVPVEEVAKACNVTKATVYYYYATKAELFTAAMLAMMERIHQRTLQILSEDSPLRERFLLLAEVHLQATTSIDLTTFLRENHQVLTTQQMQKMKEAEEEIFQVLEFALEKAMRDGEIRKVNKKFAANAYLSLLRMGNQNLANGSELFKDPKGAAIEILEFYWRSLQN
ncbi:TetR/AcrR family transcriptional regulator [Lederbergia lenta]|uniref:TetR family transcriptional regulator n=1 Tax=Lederbergia lenta TaxID=1467 RepID=A0A2X4WH35_LEDLE|nr:TetR/AcrR family transcriptional regulator [Lederbergia lenta]MEC2323402.1 TetR/AcrR family transcriptional regulator [Lederbergia lenta]SQI63356.1 TetR family transcriptional regulator [Lederbergia lenta]